MNRKLFLTFCLLIAVTVIGWSQETASLPQYAEGLKRLFPEYARLVKTEARGYVVQNADGAELGRLLVEYAREGEKARGFNGPIELALAFQDGKAIGVLIGANDETPRFLLRVTEGGLPDAWNGATLEELAARDVKPVTGATYSSKAIIADVRRLALHHLKYHGAEPPAAPSTLAEECNDGGCENRNTESMDGCEHGGKKSMDGCEHGGKQAMGGCEHGGKKSMGGCEHGDKQTMVGCEHGGKQSMGGCEHGGKKSMVGCEHGGKQAMGGCEHGGKQSMGGCEHGGKQAMGGCEHGGKQAMGGCEHGGKQSMGGCEHGGKKSMGDCEHGKAGHDSCRKPEPSDVPIAEEVEEATSVTPEVPEVAPASTEATAE